MRCEDAGSGNSRAIPATEDAVSASAQCGQTARPYCVRGSTTVRRKELRMSSMALPYQEPLVPREPGERQIPEPPRRGEEGGPPCAICGGNTTGAVWSDDNWTLHPPVGGSLPGAVWLANHADHDSVFTFAERGAVGVGRGAAG